MIGRIHIALLIMLIANVSVAQRPHFEIGGTLGFKDEFHYRPSFDTTAQFTEFHIYDLYAFTRVSKRNLGGEFGLGFEKAGNYFVRRFDNTTEAKYMELNRISVDLSSVLYLIKKAKSKWDLELGFRSYFNLTRFIEVPDQQLQKTWKLAGRVTTNYTFKSFIVGVYYEHDIRTDYFFKPNNATFGLRCGVIY